MKELSFSDGSSFESFFPESASALSDEAGVSDGFSASSAGCYQTRIRKLEVGIFCGILYYSLGLDCSIHHKTIRRFDLKNNMLSFKSQIIYEFSRNNRWNRTFGLYSVGGKTNYPLFQANKTW